MRLREIAEELKGNAYPGRGILLGRSADGGRAVIAYFIMGRSENSRNRVFVPDGAGIRTQAFDPARLKDPSLIIYSPVRVLDNVTIVTNGDQTDTVYQFLREGGTFEDALRTRTFEPDAPNFTPRISGLVTVGETFGYRLSILKSAGGDPSGAERFFFEYDNPPVGRGHFIHTYRCDGDPLPSFEGEPVPVAVGEDIRAFADTVWNSLNEENKVSLFVRFLDLQSGEAETVILNKNK